MSFERTMTTKSGKVVTLGALAGIPCPTCKQPTQWRRGKYGVFAGCMEYPTCKGIAKEVTKAPEPQFFSQKIGVPSSFEITPVFDEGNVEWILRCMRAAYIVTGDAYRWKESIMPSEESRVFSELDVGEAVRRYHSGSSNKGEQMPPKKKEIDVTPTTPAQTGLGATLWGEIRPLALEEVSVVAARAAAQEIAKSATQALKVEWHVNNIKIAELEGARHKALGEVMKRVKAGLKNILLVGPAGSGKTQLASDLAKALNRQFSAVSCTAGMPEWHLVGRSMPNLTNGESVYQTSRLVELYEQGGVALLDEVDAADPNTLLVMNSAVSNGHWSLPSRHAKPIAERHPDFIFIGAANTFGNGASRQYVGRNQLDASTLSRFACSIIEVDYDRDLETALCGDAKILSRVWGVREKVQELGLRQVVGTRELLNATALVKSGESLNYALKAMTVAWTPDERSRVGV